MSLKTCLNFQGSWYSNLMEGCYKMYSVESCNYTEIDRIQMNRMQPATQYNYTSLGFKKLRLPSELYNKIKAFWDKNKNQTSAEEYFNGYTYINHWDSPSRMVNFENKNFTDGLELKQEIWDGVKPILQDWVKQEIVPVSLYGIRIYYENSILAPHVDRSPLVTSCIINVDQVVDEPWPLEVYSHDGIAYNVSMEPGDIVLYESHTVLHGRPFPLKGNGSFFANIFVHFEPVDHKKLSEPWTGDITKYEFYEKEELSHFYYATTTISDESNYTAEENNYYAYSEEDQINIDSTYYMEMDTIDDINEYNNTLHEVTNQYMYYYEGEGSYAHMHYV